jgi:hypothetical protein
MLGIYFLSGNVGIALSAMWTLRNRGEADRDTARWSALSDPAH